MSPKMKILDGLRYFTNSFSELFESKTLSVCSSGLSRVQKLFMFFLILLSIISTRIVPFSSNNLKLINKPYSFRLMDSIGFSSTTTISNESLVVYARDFPKYKKHVSGGKVNSFQSLVKHGFGGVGSFDGTIYGLSGDGA